MLARSRFHRSALDNVLDGLFGNLDGPLLGIVITY